MNRRRMPALAFVGRDDRPRFGRSLRVVLAADWRRGAAARRRVAALLAGLEDTRVLITDPVHVEV